MLLEKKRLQGGAELWGNIKNAGKSISSCWCLTVRVERGIPDKDKYERIEKKMKMRQKHKKVKPAK